MPVCECVHVCVCVDTVGGSVRVGVRRCVYVCVCVLCVLCLYINISTHSYTYSPGKETFTLGINGKHGRIRVWREILDRNDGTFMIRFRLYNSHRDISLEIKHDGKHVARSPYIFKGIQCFDKKNLYMNIYFI